MANFTRAQKVSMLAQQMYYESGCPLDGGCFIRGTDGFAILDFEMDSEGKWTVNGLSVVDPEPYVQTASDAMVDSLFRDWFQNNESFRCLVLEREEA